MARTPEKEIREIARVGSKADPSDSPTASTNKPIRIWAFHCPFRKNGSPVLGSFGATVRPVVILPMETWTKLCRDIPALGATQFEVGSED